MHVVHFTLDRRTLKNEEIHLYFKDRIIVPNEVKDCILIAFGFHNRITIQDFPFRRNMVYLHSKCRRWLDKQFNKVVHRDWNF